MARKRSNGEGTLRRRADGRWESAITTGYRADGKPNRKYFYGRTQKEVKEKVEAWKSKGKSKLTQQDYTFKEWSDFWFEHHKENISATTQENYKYTLRILQNYFEERMISEIKALDVEEFLKNLRKEGRSDSYISTCRGLLHHMFRKAEANDIVAKNPVALADKMKSTNPKAEKEAFTAEEVLLLMKNLPMDRIGVSIRLMLATGMRGQEILALEPQHIAEDGSVIRIKQAVKLVKGTATLGGPKSKDSYRDIPVPPNMRQYAIALRETENIFVGEAGKPYAPCNPSHFRKRFKEAIAAVEGVRVLTPHCCRHTYVSQMQALGVDLETIQSIVGHADIDMTKHYLHVQEPKRQEAVELFSKTFGATEE